MIQEDYVSFETAKLLKEKGFDECCYVKYKYVKEFDDYFQTTEYVYDGFEKYYYPCPTLQIVTKWLREVHSLYLDITTSFSQDGICYTFSCSNTMDLIQGTKGSSYHEYQTYEEACEAGIRYTLENLI